MFKVPVVECLNGSFGLYLVEKPIDRNYLTG